MKTSAPAGLSSSLINLANTYGYGDAVFQTMPLSNDRAPDVIEQAGALGPRVQIEAAFADVTESDLAAALDEAGISWRGDDGSPALTITEIETAAGTLRTFISGYFPISALMSLDTILADAGMDGQFIQANEGLYASAVGDTTSQGDAAQQSDVGRTNFSVDGSGITVGVISDSFGFELGADGETPTATTVAQDIASGDLPANSVVLLEGTALSTDGDEGRAMAQIIHDVAPGADIAFHTSRGGQSVFANGINELATTGNADVIVDDIIYFAEPIFQDGIIAQAATSFYNDGGVYLSSAGNNANDAFLDVFRGSGVDANTIPALAALLTTSTDPLGQLHDWNDDPTVFAPYLQLTVDQGNSFDLSFQWDEAFASAGGSGSTSDLDIFITEVAEDGSETAVDFGVANNIGSDAVEIVGVDEDENAAKTYRLYITEFDAPDDVSANIIAGVFFLNGGRLVSDYDPVMIGANDTEIAVPTVGAPTSFGHSNATGALAVGASAWFNTPEFNSGLSAARLNSFSSQGGYNILFDAAGNRLASPDQRDGVDFVAPDGGNTTFFGSDSGADADTFPNFFGTSAAAPHAAGIVALLLESVPNLTPDQVEQLLEGSASAITQLSSGAIVDSSFTGTGLVDANVALTNAQALVVNEAPVVLDDGFTIFDKTKLALGSNVFDDNGNGADSDPEDSTLTVTAVNGDPALVGQFITAAGGGRFALAANGDLVFATDEAYFGLQEGESATESFTYTAADDQGATATATVTVTINGVNDAPTAVDDAFGLFQTDIDLALGSVFADNGNGADSDPDDETLSIVAVNGDSGIVGEAVVLSNGATVQISANGDIVATGTGAAALALGETSDATVTYTAEDSGGSQATATATITVTGINDAPIAADDLTLTIVTAPLTAFDLIGNDTDVDNGDTFTVTAIDTTGTQGVVTDNLDGTVDYDPTALVVAPGTSVTDTFSYTITDSEGATNQATVTFVVLESNTTPTAGADAFDVDENESNVLAVLANDDDADIPLGDFLSIQSFDDTGLLGTLTDNLDGTLTYAAGVAFDGLRQGETATDSFTYTVTDGFGSTAVAAAEITIIGENDAPVALDDTASVDETGVLVAVDLLANDLDPDIGDVLTVVSIDASSALGSLTSNGDGTFTYDPGTAFRGLTASDTATDVFTYVVEDEVGIQTQGTLTVDIIGEDNLAAIDDTATANIGDTTLISVLDNDSSPAGGSIFIAGFDTSNTNGRIVGFSESGFSYRADTALTDLVAGAEASDSFGYTIEDDAGDQQSASVDVTVIGTRVATSGDDTIFGTSAAESFSGGDGNDLLMGDGPVDVAQLLADLGLSSGDGANAASADEPEVQSVSNSSGGVATQAVDEVEISQEVLETTILASTFDAMSSSSDTLDIDPRFFDIA